MYELWLQSDETLTLFQRIITSFKCRTKTKIGTKMPKTDNRRRSMTASSINSNSKSSTRGNQSPTRAATSSSTSFSALSASASDSVSFSQPPPQMKFTSVMTTPAHQAPPLIPIFHLQIQSARLLSLSPTHSRHQSMFTTASRASTKTTEDTWDISATPNWPPATPTQAVYPFIYAGKQRLRRLLHQRTDLPRSQFSRRDAARPRRTSISLRNHRQNVLPTSPRNNQRRRQRRLGHLPRN